MKNLIAEKVPNTDHIIHLIDVEEMKIRQIDLSKQSITKLCKDLKRWENLNPRDVKKALSNLK